MDTQTSVEKFDDFPRIGSAEYKMLFGDSESQKKTLKTWKRLNKYFSIPMYKLNLLPLFGFGKIFLLLLTKGRKTGKSKVSPLEYRKRDGVIHIVAGRGRKAHWLKNMQANPDEVCIKLGFKKFNVHFDLLSSVEEKNDFFRWYVAKYPQAAKMLFGWDPKSDDPNSADFTSFSKLVEIIQLKPNL